MEFIIPKNNDIKKTICFTCICKNEEKCILIALNSVYKFISYWIICDTGSTDNTCDLIVNFFKEKNIPGELYHDEFINAGHNKTLMIERCYRKADYILHFDADDYFVGNLNFTGGKTQYLINVKRNGLNFPNVLLYNANYKWKFTNLAHSCAKCIDCNNITEDNLSSSDFYIYNTNNIGARSSDPEKFSKEAELLKQQFFSTLISDPDDINSRTLFYTAQSYRDCSKFEESAKWYNLYLKVKNTWIEEEYYAYLQLGYIYRELKYSFSKIEEMYISATKLIPDRAEAYLELGIFYNQNNKHNEAYNILMQGKMIDFKNSFNKYKLFLNEKRYGKYFYNEFAVSCYYLQKYDEGLQYLNEIINDLDFNEIERNNFQTNINFFNMKMKNYR